MVRHQSIFFSEIGVYVRFKILSQDEASIFVEAQENVPRFQYIINVLKKCIYNLNTDVMASMVNFDQNTCNGVLKSLYNGCIMSNPALSSQTWVHIAQMAPPEFDLVPYFRMSEIVKGMDPQNDDNDEGDPTESNGSSKATQAMARRKALKPFKLTQAKFANLDRYLKERVIGQEEAVTEVCNALRMHHAGLNDSNRPIATFLFAGPSGTGKTYLAQELHAYMFGGKHDMLRIDCGEFQHRHENQKLLGSPPGYVGHDDGGLLKYIAANPNSVVLLDEVEKAHPDILNTFLRVFDEGKILDNKGNMINFCNTVIIMTSNLGNGEVAELLHNRSAGFRANVEVDFRSSIIPTRSAVERATKEAMKKFFKPEFINRIDSTVIFNFLSQENCQQIAEQQLEISAEKVGKLGYVLTWNDEVINKFIELGYNTLSNARGMRGIRSKYIDHVIASRITTDSSLKRGDIFNLVITNDGMFDIELHTPKELGE